MKLERQMGPHNVNFVVLLRLHLTYKVLLSGAHSLPFPSIIALPTSTLQFACRLVLEERLSRLGLEDGISGQKSGDTSVSPARLSEAVTLGKSLLFPGTHSSHLGDASSNVHPAPRFWRWDSRVPKFHDSPRFCNLPQSFHDSQSPKSSYIDPHPQFLRPLSAALTFYCGGSRALQSYELHAPNFYISSMLRSHWWQARPLWFSDWRVSPIKGKHRLSSKTS